MKALLKEDYVCGIKDNWFTLADYRLNKLPNYFRCMGSLNCDGSSIEELPDHLYIKDNLYIGECPLEKLPNNLVIGGSLILLNSNIFDLPNDICVCGDIVALKVNNAPLYTKNTLYNGFVCDNDGKPFPFSHSTIVNQEGGLHGDLPRESICFYMGYERGQGLARRKTSKIYYHCKDLYEAIEIGERSSLKDKKDIYNKYLNYDINEKRFVKDLTQMYVEITNACKKGVDLFFEKTPYVVKDNKYSIKELCDILDKDETAKGFPYTFLFIDYFLHREKFDLTY